MARHLGDVSRQEFEGAYDALVAWLERANVAGSIAGDYNLYRALESTWATAREAVSRPVDEDEPQRRPA